jgi:DNA gyrase subunit A
VVTVTDGGFAKRTSVDEYRLQGRGGLGIRVAKLPDDRGHLVGAAVVEESDELLVVMERGRVVRSKVSEVPAKGRTTMGVVFAKPDKKDRILLVTTGQESEVDEDEAEAPEIVDADPQGGDSPSADPRSDAQSAAEGTEGGDAVEISADAASDAVGEQADVLGSDESDLSPTGDADPNEE